MSGRMPTTMNSLMPSMKLDAMRITTGRLKNRSLSIRTFPLSASVRIPLFVSRYFDLFSIAYVNRLTIYFLQERINRARYNTVPMTRKMTRKTNRSGNSGGKTGGNRSRNRKTSNRKTGNRKSLVPKNLRRKLRNTWNKASLKQRIGMIATTLVATVAAIAIIAGLIRFVGWRVQVSEAKAAQSEIAIAVRFQPGQHHIRRRVLQRQRVKRAAGADHPRPAGRDVHRRQVSEDHDVHHAIASRRTNIAKRIRADRTKARQPSSIRRATHAASARRCCSPYCRRSSICSPPPIQAIFNSNLQWA